MSTAKASAMRTPTNALLAAQIAASSARDTMDRVQMMFML